MKKVFVMSLLTMFCAQAAFAGGGSVGSDQIQSSEQIVLAKVLLRQVVSQKMVDEDIAEMITVALDGATKYLQMKAKDVNCEPGLGSDSCKIRIRGDAAGENVAVDITVRSIRGTVQSVNLEFPNSNK